MFTPEKIRDMRKWTGGGKCIRYYLSHSILNWSNMRVSYNILKQSGAKETVLKYLFSIISGVGSVSLIVMIFGDKVLIGLVILFIIINLVIGKNVIKVRTNIIERMLLDESEEKEWAKKEIDDCFFLNCKDMEASMYICLEVYFNSGLTYFHKRDITTLILSHFAASERENAKTQLKKVQNKLKVLSKWASETHTKMKEEKDVHHENMDSIARKAQDENVEDPEASDSPNLNDVRKDGKLTSKKMRPELNDDSSPRLRLK